MADAVSTRRVATVAGGGKEIKNLKKRVQQRKRSRMIDDWSEEKEEHEKEMDNSKTVCGHKMISPDTSKMMKLL